MSEEIIKFWNSNNLNKGLLIVSVLVLIYVVYSLSQETFMMWYFLKTTKGDYTSNRVKKFPGGFQDPNSIYIDKFALPPPAKAQDEPPHYNPPNPFAKLNFENDNEEGYGISGPFSFSPRFGISSNFCSVGPRGKSCYAQNCKDCNNAFEQDTSLTGSIKLKPSEQMYT